VAWGAGLVALAAVLVRLKSVLAIGNRE
jgi:hypothetical protein